MCSDVVSDLVSGAREILAKVPSHTLANKIAVVAAYSELLALNPHDVIYQHELPKAVEELRILLDSHLPTEGLNAKIRPERQTGH